MSKEQDIPFFNNDPLGKLTEEKLRAYMEGSLSAAEQHEVEQWLSEAGMESDALEGLQSAEAEENLRSADRVNRKLARQLRKQKDRKKHPYSTYWTIIALLIVLLVCILGYWVLRLTLAN